MFGHKLIPLSAGHFVGATCESFLLPLPVGAPRKHPGHVSQKRLCPQSPLPVVADAHGPLQSQFHNLPTWSVKSGHITPERPLLW